jgi:hypothetical protein
LWLVLAHPIPAVAAPLAATQWGIDSCSTAQSVVPPTQQSMGDPQFMARYLTNYCGTALSTSEVAYLQSQGISVLLIADPGRFGSANPGGAVEAANAIREAEQLGAPPGTAIFRDVETGDTITAAYVESWYQTFAQSPSGYVPGFYENAYTGAFTGSSGAYCTAVAALPSVASGVVLWSSELEPNYGNPNYDPTSSNAPSWGPFTPPCANTTVAWQYEENGGFPGNDPAPNVDVDLYNPAPAYPALLWGAGSSTVLANGTPVSYGGNAYIIAGNAPLYVSNWGDIPGGQESTLALSAAQWQALNSVPSNGTFITDGTPGPGYGAVYEMAGGAPLYVSNWGSVGPGVRAYNLWVDGWDITNTGSPLSHLSSTPSGGTFISDGSPGPAYGRVYEVVGGALLRLYSWSDIPNATPYNLWVDGWDITEAGASTSPIYNALSGLPVNGTFITDATPGSAWGQLYEIVGGAPLYVSSWADIPNVTPSSVPVDGLDILYAGTSAVSPLRAQPPDGTFVTYGTPGPSYGLVYEIVGGAPLLVNSWSDLPNVTPYTLWVDGWDIGNAGSSLSHLNAVPTSGTFVTVATPGTAYGQIYEIVGGAPLPVQSWTDIPEVTPYDLGVDGWDIANAGSAGDALGSVPANGTYITEASSNPAVNGSVYVIAGGAPLYVSSWSDIPSGYPGYTLWVDGWDLTNLGNAATHLNTVPANGTFITEGSTNPSVRGSVFEIAGGAPLYVRTWSDIPGGYPGYTLWVDGWNLTNIGNSADHLNSVPANGTYITEDSSNPAVSGSVFVIAGGAPLYVSSWNDIPGGYPGSTLWVDGWDLDNIGNPLDRLNALPSNGTYITEYSSDPAVSGSVFVIAGGAPLYVKTWSDIPSGYPGYTLWVDSWDLDNLGAAADHLSAVPANGTFVTAGSTASPAVYEIAGGAPLLVSTWSDIPGGNPGNTLWIDSWDLANLGSSNIHLNPVPANGTYITEDSSNPAVSGSVFLIAGGAPMYVSTWADIPGGYPAYTLWVDGWNLANLGNTDDHLNPVPANGTYLTADSSNPAIAGSVFVVAGGAPLYVSNWSDIPGGYPGSTLWVDGWDLTNIGNPSDHLNAVPSNGTFLVTAGATYRVAGGAALPILNCTVLGGCGGAVTIDGWDVAHAGSSQSHLSAAPLAGTVVEGLPSGAYWVYQSGGWVATGSTASAVPVDDTSV